MLVAPLDVEWVWHCHLLAPVAYSTDCVTNYGCVIDHVIPEEGNYQQSLAFAERYWAQKYPAIPFSVDLFGSDIDEGQLERSRSFEFLYDLVAAASRQRMFYYQVSLPHYRDEKFLGKCLERYKKFLFLKRKHPDTFLVPCYDMDIMWHTHMNFSASYRTVTELILGKVLSHDDSVNDRSVGSKLNKSYAITLSLWKQEYKEHYSSYGAMWRGDPPNGKLHEISKDTCFSLVSKNAVIKFNQVEVQGHGCHSLGKFKLHITEKDEVIMSGRYHGEKETVDISEKHITLKGPQLAWENVGSLRKCLQCLKSDNLCIQIVKSESLMCCTSGSSEVGDGKIDLDSWLPKFSKVKESFTEDVKVDIDSDLFVAMNMTLTLTKLGQCDLWLVPGTYEECVMPEQIEQLWGPVPLPRLPPGVTNNCSVASHR